MKPSTALQRQIRLQCLHKRSLIPSARFLRRPPSLARAFATTHSHQHPSPRGRLTETPSSFPSEPRNPLDSIATHRAEAERQAYHKRRIYLSGAGLVLSILATVVLVNVWHVSPAKTEALPRPGNSAEKIGPDAVGGDVQIELVDKAATGASAVPFFPRTIRLPHRESSASPALPAGIGDAREEYHLLGLGVRTVSFLRIQVYVVGLYIAASDLSKLQATFVRRAADVDGASALVPSEKDALRQKLLDASESEDAWDTVLREAGVRSVLRIVPTRDTDMAHLRDGWVRAIEGRAGKSERYVRADDEGFGASVADFKKIFSAGGRKIKKGATMLLERDSRGVFRAWVEDKGAESGFERMGEIDDERVARLIWLGYLAGDKVASKAARESVVDGVIEAVGRPVGTIETQVV